MDYGGKNYQKQTDKYSPTLSTGNRHFEPQTEDRRICGTLRALACDERDQHLFVWQL